MNVCLSDIISMVLEQLASTIPGSWEEMVKEDFDNDNTIPEEWKQKQHPRDKEKEMKVCGRTKQFLKDGNQGRAGKNIPKQTTKTGCNRRGIHREAGCSRSGNQKGEGCSRRGSHRQQWVTWTLTR